MKLLIQPGDGVGPLVKAIKKAKKSVEILIFRFDQPQIEKALIDAVERGVFVHALIAFTNRGGEKNLRKLETRFLAKGITVARTAGDLVRYHGKMLLIDRKELHLLAFNFSHLDIEHSRSFGVVTRNPKLVQEGVRLFEADTKRQVYAAGHARFVVSPVNARKELIRFLKGAKKELLIYDPKVSDRAVLRVLEERAGAGVKICLIGAVSGARLNVRELTRMRLHTRTIVRDRHQAFIGSQSLRQLELDRRREIGVIFRDPSVIKSLVSIFEDDWTASKSAKAARSKDVKALHARAAKKLARAVSKSLQVELVAEKVAKELRRQSNGKLNHKKVREAVSQATKDAVNATVKGVAKETLKKAVNEAVTAEGAHG